MHPEHDLVNTYFFHDIRILLAVAVNSIVFFDVTTCIYIDTLYVPTSTKSSFRVKACYSTNLLSFLG